MRYPDSDIAAGAPSLRRLQRWGVLPNSHRSAHVRPERANFGLFPSSMPKNLKRYYGRGDLHFLTFSCYRRLPGLGTAKTRNEFLLALDEVRTKYGFALVGYVVMPEHVHLLLSEPERSNLAVALQMLKQIVSHKLHDHGEKPRAASRSRSVRVT